MCSSIPRHVCPCLCQLPLPLPQPNPLPQVVPDNIVVAAVNTNVLGLITFSLMFGVALGSLGEGREAARMHRRN